MNVDFEALARAWVEGSPRSRELVRSDPERADRLVLRLARALEERRRQESAGLDERGDLVIQVDRSRFVPGVGLDEEALDEVTRYIEEVARGNAD
ncbi:MAG: hypothetical protein ACOX9B_04985 [Candidatus Xenobium sp.]|jgi:hypothetical protein|nr:hypothetical protein [Burkholderiales bacterium]